MKKIIFTSIVLCCLFSACSGSMVNKDFENFANDFISNGINSYEGFGMYCESKLETTVVLDKKEQTVLEDPAYAFPYLRQFFSLRKYDVYPLNKLIYFKIEKTGINLHFRRDESGKWKLYKYETL